MKAFWIGVLFSQTVAASLIPAPLIIADWARNQKRPPQSWSWLVKVQVPGQSEALLVRENWFHLGRGELRLQARGVGALEQWSIDRTYRDGKRFFRTNEGEKSENLLATFHEHFFVLNDRATLTRELQRRQLLSSEALAYEARYRNPQTWAPGVQLSRAEGKIAFKLMGSAPDRAIWIDQSDFQLKKIRFNPNVLVRYHSPDRASVEITPDGRTEEFLISLNRQSPTARGWEKGEKRLSQGFAADQLSTQPLTADSTMALQQFYQLFR